MSDQHRRGTLGLLAGAALLGGSRPARAQIGMSSVVALRGTGSQPEAAYTDSAEVRTGQDFAARMTASVRIEGRGTLQFLVDTGADRTTISREAAEALQLPSGEPVVMHGVAGALQVPTVKIGSLEVGDRRMTDLVAPVLEQAHLGAAGLLGIDSLRDQRLLLDFKNTRMVIQGGRKYPRDPDAIVVRAKSRYGQLTLVDAWLDHREVVVIVDSGAESTIANSAFHDRVARMRLKQAPEDVEVLSVTGQSAWGAGDSIPELRLGGFTVRNLPVVYSDLHTFARWGVGNEPAMLLGVDVLRKFNTVWIDFIRKEVRFRLPDAALTERSWSLIQPSTRG